MKRIALILALVLSAFTFTALAQNSGAMPPGHQMLASPEAFADGHLAALDKQVGLSAEQKPQLRAVFLAKKVRTCLRCSATPRCRTRRSRSASSSFTS